jgi:hypothetical protein
MRGTLPDPITEPTVSFPRALELLGLGKTQAYQLLKGRPEELPFPLIRCGRAVRVPTRSLLRLLDVDGHDPPP